MKEKGEKKLIKYLHRDDSEILFFCCTHITFTVVNLRSSRDLIECQRLLAN